VRELYGTDRAVEGYWCNYGLSAEWETRLASAGLRVTARGGDDEVRALELDDHPFYVATLFLPQLRSAPDAPHPIIRGFAAAASARS
jgi:CTP synthase (UTP-ammonia lyase)